MKKALILIIAGVCLFQISGLSQKSLVGITGGVSFSNIYGHTGGNDTRGDSRAGFTLGMVVDAPIGKTAWSFQPGLHYVQKGDFSSKSSTVKNVIALRYAELDANFIHYTKSSTKLFFGLGPYLGLNLPSKTVVITDQARTPTSITFGKNNADMFRGVDYGANGILGVRFKCNVTFAVNYAFGIRNLIPQPEGNDDVLRNGYVAFRLGYLFKNAPKK